MRIYEVIVDCWWLPPKKGSEPKRVRRKVMLECADRHEARTKGVEYMDGRSDCTKNWIAFDFVQSGTVTFPLELEGSAKRL